MIFELTKEQKEVGIDEIKRYFRLERDEDLGDLSAMLLLDFIADKFGPYFYNLGLSDARGFLIDQLDDLYSLEK